MAEQGFRITYATMSADNEELHSGYDAGHRGGEVLARPEASRSYVNGEAREGRVTTSRARRSTARVIWRIRAGRPREDVRDAVAAAKAASPRVGEPPVAGARRAIMRNAADLMTEQRNELAALMAMEVGKNRLEALGDVEESADLIRWNANEVERTRRLPQADAGARRAGRVLRRAAARTACGP